MIPFMLLIASSSITRGHAFWKVPLQERPVPPAEMWTSRLAESAGDGAADAVVVALDMSTPQGQRRKKRVSVGINDEGTTPTRSRLNVLATFTGGALISPLTWAHHPAISRGSCTLLACAFTFIKSIAKIGH
jgi:hypothetical protein